MPKIVISEDEAKELVVHLQEAEGRLHLVETSLAAWLDLLLPATPVSCAEQLALNLGDA